MVYMQYFFGFPTFFHTLKALYMERIMFQAQMLELTSHLETLRVEDILSASTPMVVLTMIFVEKMEFIRFTKVCQSLS